MPYNENYISPGSLSPNHPGNHFGVIPVTHSFEERQLTAEFDDALCDQAPWKNPRYNGSKLTAKKINQFTPPNIIGLGDLEIGESFYVGGEGLNNEFIYPGEWPGDITLQQTPVIENKTTALYISNTLIGGTENPQFATIKNHSYLGIQKILLINPFDDSVTIIDKITEPYEGFHRFITNDFPTGEKCKIKVIDESISNNLKLEHRVKMNKGYLLKTFSFTEAGEYSGSQENRHANVLVDNNAMYLYKSGSFTDNYLLTGSTTVPTPTPFNQPEQLRFRYGIIEMIPEAVNSTSTEEFGHKFTTKRIGPLFTSASIHENKFTQQYYTGSYGFIKHQIGGIYNETFGRLLASTSLGSASRFIGVDTLEFLKDNNQNVALTEREKTELHVTFFEGNKSFAPNQHDERSIGTFEVDGNKAQLGIEQGGSCQKGLPTSHEITFKGPKDERFLPTIGTFNDNFYNAHLEAISTGCAPTGSGIESGAIIEKGVTLDYIENANIFVQGGALGAVGFTNAVSGTFQDAFGGTTVNTNYGISQQPNMNKHNFYSGSFTYEMSFLDKDHTLIIDLNKNDELFDGIGEKGLVLIPENTINKIKNNIEFYLKKAGIIENTSNNIQNIT